MFIAWNKFT